MQELIKIPDDVLESYHKFKSISGIECDLNSYCKSLINGIFHDISTISKSHNVSEFYTTVLPSHFKYKSIDYSKYNVELPVNLSDIGFKHLGRLSYNYYGPCYVIGENECFISSDSQIDDECITFEPKYDNVITLKTEISGLLFNRESVVPLSTNIVCDDFTCVFKFDIIGMLTKIPPVMGDYVFTYKCDNN